MQAQAAGGGGGGESLLQNKKVQIGVISVGGIAIIAVICMVLFSGNGSSPDVSPAVNPASGSPEVGASGAYPSGEPGAPPTPGGAPTPGALMPTTPSVGGAPGMASATPGAPGAVPGKENAPVATSPGVPRRANPFEENSDLKDAIGSIPKPVGPPELPETMAPELHVYSELNPPKPKDVVEDDDVAGPPIPPMRVAGVVFGNQVTATLQIGDQFLQVRPGQMIPDGNPVYRVERIEQDRVELVRRWQRGDKKGVQRFEVTLQGGAQQRNPGSGFYGGGRPGMPGGGGNGPGGNGAGF